MGRIAGTPNKLTKEVKAKLALIVDEVVDSIDVDTLNNNEKIKLLQIGIQYMIPRLKHITNESDIAEQPLFRPLKKEDIF